MTALADPSNFTSLLDIADDAARRLGDQRVLSLRTDDGREHEWSARELVRRSKLAAWRLRAAGLARGDRFLLLSPSTPEIAALFLGAMRAGAVLVPLDMRMTAPIIERIAANSDAAWLIVGADVDMAAAELDSLTGLRRLALSDLPAEADDSFPADWEAQVQAWERPDRSDLFQIVYTSGTTGQPRGVMVTHGNLLGTIEAAQNLYPRWEHRAVSLLPLSHQFGQVELFYILTMNGEILYVRSRNPRILFEAMAEHRMTTMNVVPQMLDLFWTSIVREVDRQGKRASFERARSIARRLPYWARRIVFRRLHKRLGGQLRLFASGAAFLPPSLQRAWQDMGIVVIQAYGTTECGLAAATSFDDHPAGTVGRPKAPVRLKVAADGEILVAGPTVSQGYWRDSERGMALADADGWYHTGDMGRINGRGDLVLSGRKKDIIVLPNGLNVYPEDIENALRIAGLRDTVVVETEPGRIEAIVGDPDVLALPGSTPPEPRTPDEEAALRRRIDAAVRAANANLTSHERIDAWRMWPEPDFPRTHTLKIKRDPVRAWATATAAVPLPVREAASA